MSELIPRLHDLCFTGNRFQVDPAFAEGFVKLHGGIWEPAQDHWEQVVERILNSDAVPERASGRSAMAQAVLAASIILTRTFAGRCPLCPRPAAGIERSRRVAT
jgi:hypothetical protein